MAKDTDKILKQFDGYANTSAKALRGTAFFKHYDNLESLLKNETKEYVVTMFNRMTRVDAINTVNRPDATPTPVRELSKLTKAANAETQARITAEIQVILDREKAKAELSK